MLFRNTTNLASERLYRMFLKHTAPYRHDRLQVHVRYSRGSEFSGACYYRDARLFINLGRQNRYPYTFGTHLAKARSARGFWWREVLRITVSDAYQLALFIYLHELFHYLVKAAGRNTRRKEAMCDRFAAGVLVDHYGCAVHDRSGAPADTTLWRFQDLHKFVAGAPRETGRQVGAAPAAIPVRIVGM